MAGVWRAATHVMAILVTPLAVVLTPVPASAIPNLVGAPDVPALAVPWGTGLYAQNGVWWASGRAQVRFEAVGLGGSDFSSVTGHRTALHIVNRSPRAPNVYGTTSQRIAVAPHRLYRLAVWARAAGMASNGAVSVTLDPGWTTRPIAFHGGTYDWRYYTVVFDSGAASSVDLRVLSEDVGEAWLTGFLLHEVTDAADGVVHVAYSYGRVPAHAFFFPPDQFVVAGGATPVHHTAITFGGVPPALLVNGTFVVASREPRAPPPLPVGDFALGGSDWRFDLQGGARWIAGDNTPILSFVARRYHFGVTTAGHAVMGTGRVPPSTMSWAIGGLGGLLRAGRGVPLETSGSRLYTNIDGGNPLIAPSSGYDANWSFVGAVAGPNRVVVLPSAPSPRPPAQQPGPSFPSAPRPSGRP